MDLSALYPARDPFSHKGDFGKLLVVAGCDRLTGSAVFVGMAAMRAGCDLVLVAAPERAANAAAQHADLITVSLAGGILQKNHLKSILPLLEKCDAMVLGNGISLEKEAQEAARLLIKACTKPMVIDADGLRALAGHLDILSGKRVVLTPHADEFRSFSGQIVPRELEDRKELAKTFARTYQCVVLLKGHVDVVADSQTVYLNTTGTPLMTKGGFGDTLAGICGALLARGAPLFQAASAAAWINGRAGELAAQERGEGVLASDIFDTIPKVLPTPMQLWPA